MLTSMDEVCAGDAMPCGMDVALSLFGVQVTALRVLHHAMEWVDEADSLR